MGDQKLMISNRILIFILLAGLSVYVTLYTVSAYQIAGRWAFDQDGKDYWRYSGDMTLFPWPTGPKDVLLPVIVRMGIVDEFIYLYLIKTGVLILICLTLWMLTAIYFLKTILPLLFRRTANNWRTLNVNP
jgi:hypothetical protein